VNTTVVASIIGCVVALATFFWGRQSASKQDGQETGQILTELGYLKSNTDDIKRRLDKQDDRYIETATRLTAVEASAKQAHKSIDAIEGSAKGEG